MILILIFTDFRMFRQFSNVFSQIENSCLHVLNRKNPTKIKIYENFNFARILRNDQGTQSSRCNLLLNLSICFNSGEWASSTRQIPEAADRIRRFRTHQSMLPASSLQGRHKRIMSKWTRQTPKARTRSRTIVTSLCFETDHFEAGRLSRNMLVKRV